MNRSLNKVKIATEQGRMTPCKNVHFWFKERRSRLLQQAQITTYVDQINKQIKGLLSCVGVGKRPATLFPMSRAMNRKQERKREAMGFCIACSRSWICLLFASLTAIQKVLCLHRKLLLVISQSRTFKTLPRDFELGIQRWIQFF